MTYQQKLKIIESWCRSISFDFTKDYCGCEAHLAWAHRDTVSIIRYKTQEEAIDDLYDALKEYTNRFIERYIT